MAFKVDYEIKVDKLGREYANKIDLKTGKKTRIGVKIAKKRISDLTYRRARNKKTKELEAKGSSWKEYQTAKKVVKKEVETKYKEKGKTKTKKAIDKEIERIVMEYRIGERSRYRFDWRFWEMPECNTPSFIADAQAFNGDHFEQMKEFCQEMYNNIIASNLCPSKLVEHKNPSGGACVVVYKKLDKRVIKMFQLGEGCK